MARKTLRDQLRESAKSATAISAEHRAIVAALEHNAQHPQPTERPDAQAPQRETSGQTHFSLTQLPPVPIPAPPSSSAIDGASQPEGNRTGQLSRTIVQDNRTGQPDNRTGQPDNRTGQPDNRTGQPDRSTDHPNRTGQLTTEIGQDNRTGQLDRSTGQINRTPHSDRTRRGGDVFPLHLPLRQKARTPAQKAILGYFEKNRSHISNYAVIAAEIGLPMRTVRRGIEKLVALGWLVKKPWIQGSARGLCFDFLGVPDQDNRTGQSDMTSGHDKWPCHSDRSTGQVNWTGQLDTSIPPLRKIERKNLSISEMTMLTSWPTLSRAGFGLNQLAQIETILTERGAATDHIAQSLDHAEWELARGKMLDKEGAPVADPCAWVFRSLAQTGYYRRPKGYVSADEQALRDQEEEAKAVILAKQHLEQAQFEAWKAGLGERELREAMQGHPGGPQDAWLKRIWREERGKKSGSDVAPGGVEPDRKP